MQPSPLAEQLASISSASDQLLNAHPDRSLSERPRAGLDGDSTSVFLVRRTFQQIFKCYKPWPTRS